ncbi:MAG: prolyl oligopeptidase family serine peptidase [Verrucomicrobiales bacterium]|nr:prolyl oligopeptidase family serine peptidase [Verrucomicrobiales bacterium]
MPPRLVPFPHTALILLLTALAVSLTVESAEAPPRIYRDRVEPHWNTNQTRFWYRNELPGDQREFVIVNPETGTRYSAFQHSRVAEALAALTGRSIDAGKLPVDTLTLGGTDDALELNGEAGRFRLDLATHQLQRVEGDTADGSLPQIDEPHPSTAAGRATSVLFDNQLREEVELFWISNDGNRVSYGRLKPGETRRQNTYAGHVWIAVRGADVVAVFEAAADPQRARITEQRSSRRSRRAEAAARRVEQRTVPSPDQRWEAFVRDHNLWIRERKSGQELPLSFDGSPGQSFRKDVQRARLMGMEYDAPEPPATLPEVFWSPDSKKLVALQTRTVPERRVNLIESSPADQLQPRLSSYPYLKPGDEIPTQRPRLFGVEPAVEVPFADSLFPHPWSLDEFRWAPDSSRFTFLYNQRGHQVLRVLAVSWPGGSDSAVTLGATAEIRAIVDENCPTFFDYSNKTYLEILDASGELLWMSERSGWNHLYRVDARTGAVKNPITQGQWVVRGVDKLDVEKGQVWFRASGVRPSEDPYHVHLMRVNLDGSGLIRLTEGDGTHEIQWSPDRRYFIDTWSRVDAPPQVELRRAEDGRLVCHLEQADAAEVLRARGRFPERFHAVGRDGTTEIWGILHRPRDFDPARRYPVIENIYAGPHGQHVPKSFRAAYRHQEELADRGFVVVQIDGMGTNWRSKKFHDVAWRNIGDAGFPDRIAWLRAAAAAYPQLDLQRVGIYGGSAGGQNALRALLAHGDFYKAAVADCGCHDNRMDKIWWNEAWLGWPIGPHYAEQSNVTQAHRLQGNLMLVVGELDKNVDPSSTLQVVNALVKADKPFDFVLIPGAGHGAAESDYGRRRRIGFFRTHLQYSPAAP